MLSKYHDYICIILMVTFAPEIIDMFICPLSLSHRAGFILIGLAGIWVILQHGAKESENIQQVFEAKKVHVEGKYPRLVEKG